MKIFKTVEKGENENVDVRDKPNEVLSHSKTYSCLEVTFKWMEQQKEFSATHLMLMKLMCDAAAQKKLSSFKKNDEYDTK
ncbi:hypothetical protein T03_9627 [Trichinella britovi]|uniref:Uncharacterized protein n=1 Tax=Trichinella britovi TaxID=45882 RepID=A0A0V1D5B3_TRIBR|nr:hypothetical protein T03_9627 [Trichinella britovi]